MSETKVTFFADIFHILILYALALIAGIWNLYLGIVAMVCITALLMFFAAIAFKQAKRGDTDERKEEQPKSE